MTSPWIFLIAFFVACGAHGQYRWIDKDGKTRYGDTPPAGVKATVLGAPASGLAPVSPAAAPNKDARKGPLTPAEREQEFRKRQATAAKDQEKLEKDRQAQVTKAENCTRAKEYQRTLESGRVARTDAAGERYYMDEGQIAQELAKAQQTVAQVCAD